VERVVGAPHESFEVGVARVVTHEGRPVGQLVRGTTLLLPDVRLAELSDTGPGARSRILRRLVAFARDWVAELLAPLRKAPLATMSPSARGIAYQIEQGLGTALTRDVQLQVAELGAEERERMQELGVELGQRVAYLPALLRREAILRRVLLCAMFFDGAPTSPPRPEAASFAAVRGVPARAYTAIGYPVLGSRAVRADIAERVHRTILEGNASPSALVSLLGCPAREVHSVVEALAPPADEAAGV
jgi:ATP-dependent RNA helicase SUPV3L1/SUV3